MTTIPDIPGPPSEPPNKFTPEAQEWMKRLRTLAAEFADLADPKPLTTAEVRLARSTSVTALEKAALIIEAAPVVAGAVAADAVVLREAIAFEMAYGGVLDEARSLAASTWPSCAAS